MSYLSRSSRLGRAALPALALVLFLFASPSAVLAAITIDGLDDEEVYANRASFTIVPDADSEYEAMLDGVPVAVGELVVVDAPDYHELVVRRAPRSGGATEETTVQFIVRNPERGNSEWGLPSWDTHLPVPSAPAEFTGSTIAAVVPQAWTTGRDLPLGVRVVDAEGKRVGVNGRVEVFRKGATEPFATLRLLRGVASGSILLDFEAGAVDLELRAGPLVADVSLVLEEAVSWTEHEGNVALSLDLGEDARVRITDDLAVPAGVTLTIGAGSIVRLAPGVAIDVSGTLDVNGTRERPVVFLPDEAGMPWGGLRFGLAASRFDAEFALFTGAGADPDWFDGGSNRGSSHRDEEPLVWVANGARATLEDCFLFDLAGQGGHGEDGFLTMRRSVVQRAITTGQYNGGTVTIEDSALVEFPAFDAPFEDNDNDGLYLTGGAHFVRNTLVGWALDDGIDAGSGSGGSVEVTGSWIESCFHEGLAWSEDREATVADTVVLDCGQAVECGFGSPDVTVTGSFLSASLTGARFGDNYDWDYNGSIRVTDSIILGNYRNIWGRSWDDWDDHTERMTIAGNLLGAPDLLHPENEIWNPAADSARLRPFLPAAEGVVGVAWALRDGELDAADLAGGVPARLSSFSTLPVEVDWRLERDGESAAEGTLLFEPAESLELVELDPDLVTAGGSLRFVLVAARNAEITAPSAVGAVAKRTLISEGALWRYRDGGIDPGPTWMGTSYDDASWSEGPAELGFGDDDEATVIDGGPSDARFAAVYFRHSFLVVDPARFSSLDLRIRRDDGAVVWLNGIEVFRTNMPAGAIGPKTFASGTADDEDAWIPFTLEPDTLAEGANLLAVEVHQADSTSSDLSFALVLEARLVEGSTPATFRRGDANRDGSIDLSDAVKTLLGLFSGSSLPCEDAADVDDDGDVSITDAIRLLDWLFRGGPPPAEPWSAPGEDPTPDDLDCGA